MKKKNENTLLHGMLIVAVVLTTLVAIVLGLIVSVKPGNPIKTVMLYIQNGFQIPEDDVKKDPQTDENGQTEEPDEFDENDIFTLPPGIIIPEETKKDEITAPTIVPPVIEDTKTPSEDTREPSETEKPVTKPPVSDDVPEETAKPVQTSPPETTPPSDPVTPSDRVNDPNYFNDALFIGDSRTVGFYNYAKIEGATYFGRTSMTVKTCFNETPAEDTGIDDYHLAQLLQKNTYGKIYILLGINEIGYSLSWIDNNYKQIIATIKALQPNAIIIIQSNMHVTKSKSEAPGSGGKPNPFKNEKIDELNALLATYADNETVFYLDTTTPFDDESGNLRAEYSGDGVHFKGKIYSIWRDYIINNGKR